MSNQSNKNDKPSLSKLAGDLKSKAADKASQISNSKEFQNLKGNISDKVNQFSERDEVKNLKNNVTERVNQKKAAMTNDYIAGGWQNLLKKNIPVFAEIAAVLLVLFFMFSGGTHKNETPADLIRSVVSSTSFSDYRDNCAVNENSAETKWRKVNKELNKAEVAGEDIIILECTSRDNEDFYGRFKCNDQEFSFKQERCKYTEDLGWRTADDIDIRKL